MQVGRKRERYDLLDGLRGVVAVGVMLHHYILHVGVLGLAENGGLGVDFFFALSGFVIDAAYAQPLRSGMTTCRFLFQRFIRLYPMILFGCTLGLGIRYITGQPSTSLTAILLQFFSLPYLSGPPGNPPFLLDAPLWSIFYEGSINVVFALIIYKLSSKAIACCTVGCVAVFLFLIIAVSHTINVGQNIGSFWEGFVRVAASFLIGVMIHRLRIRLPVNKYAVVSLTLAFLALMAAPTFPKLNGVFQWLCVVVATPTLLIVASSGTSPVTPFTSKVCRALGDISYPLYAIHFPLQWLVPDDFFLHASTLSRLGAVIFLSLTAICLSILLSRYFDKPVRRRLSEISNRLVPAPPMLKFQER